MKKQNQKKCMLLACLILIGCQSALAANNDGLFVRVDQELIHSRVSDKSFQELQELALAEPNNARAHMYLGLVLDKMGLADKAVDQFELAVKYGPEDPKALVELCKNLIKGGNSEAAVGLLNQGIKKFPSSPEILYLVGDFLVQRKNFKEAQQVLAKAYRLNPKIYGLPTALAKTKLESSPRFAAQLATADLETNPNYDQALYVRGMAYRRVGKYAECAKDLQAIFDRTPMLPPLCAVLAECYYWLGEYEKAVKPILYLSALSAIPDSESSGNVPQLVRVFSPVPRNKLVADVDASMKDLEIRGLAKPELYYALGKVYDQLGMPNAAMRCYQTTIQKNPEEVRAYFRLGLDQELHLRDYKAAMDNYAIAYNRRPWDQEITMAYMRMIDRLANRKVDLAWKWKDWFNKTFSVN